MRVSISKAAEMVGVTRATLYRHIDKKGITVLKDEDDNPKIDVSELIRVYGDKVREIPSKPANTNTSGTEQTSLKQATAPQEITKKQATTPVQVEIEVFRERLSRYEAEKSTAETERERERRQLMEQIEHLQSSLLQSQEQQKRLTLLLTDQREKEAVTPPAAAATPQKPQEGQGETSGKSQEPEVNPQLDLMEKTIQKLQNQNKRIYYELQKQKDQTFFQRLFGTSGS